MVTKKKLKKKSKSEVICECSLVCIEIPVQTTSNNKNYQLFGCTDCGKVIMKEIN